MEQEAFKTLAYDKIKEMLTGCASSNLGKRLARELLPSSDFEEVASRLAETDEAVLIMETAAPPLGGIRDISSSLHKVELGAVLDLGELVEVRSTMYAMRNVKYFFRDLALDVPLLKELARGTEILGELERQLENIIDEHGNIREDASVELRRINRELRSTQSRIKDKIAGLLYSAEYQKYFQDAIVTVRDERYVIPVKQEYRSHFPGIVHDQSASGSTLFIEPMAVVDMNNDVKQLILAREQEMNRLLKVLTQQISRHREILEANCDILAEIDFTFAKAKLAREMEAARPKLNDEGRTVLKQARHPLIDKEKVVPIDIVLGTDYRMLLVTGPNTGGKTVTLKTIGLFELMGMAGLHIPAGDRSELSLFREVFADIGDEQSIEQSLSTFSSHMTTIVDIFRRVDRQCLCLFDELGAGTDPTEGAALAISILNFCHVRKIRTLATTHYAELKAYAMRTEGIVNASCEFNVETLQPTYHLMVGVPGKSNAFAISQKLGLPNYIIETAKEQLSKDAKRLRAYLEQEKKKQQDREKQFEKRREELLQKANEEARDILARAKEEADQAISDLRKASQGGRHGGDLSAMERTRTALRNKVNEKNSKVSFKKQETPKGRKLKPSDLHVGDKVRVISMGLTGTVSTLPDKNNKVNVRCGILQSKVDLSDLQLIAEDAYGNPVNSTKQGGSAIKRAFRDADKASASGKEMDLSRGSSVSTELNLLGMTTDDAVYAVDKYLDEARVAHLQSVRIVHGKGTGALRNAVHAYLRKQKWIKSFRLGDFGEGDAGVTIVTLRN